MLRRLVASLLALALLVGFAAAPHTHLHRSGHGVVRDAHHTRARAAFILHAHLPPHEGDHEHDVPAHGEDRDGREVLSVDSFLFQVGAGLHWPSAAVLAHAVPHVYVPGTWLRVTAYQPPAHGPPAHFPPAARAPPFFPSAAA